MAIPSFSMPVIPAIPKLNISALESPTIPKLPDTPVVPGVAGVQATLDNLGNIKTPAISAIPGIPMIPGPGPSLPSSIDMANLDPRKLENLAASMNVMASAQDAMKTAVSDMSNILNQVVSKINGL